MPVTPPLTAAKAIAIACAFAILIIDQISKWAITEVVLADHFYGQSLGLIEWFIETPNKLPFLRIEITSFFNLVMVWNYGVSFGLFNNIGDLGPMLLTTLTGVLIAGFCVWLFYAHSKIQLAAIALVIGGGIGNLIDRIRFDAVIDFLDFHIAGYHWPAFNVADCCIVIGIFLLIIHSLFFEKQPQQ